MLFREDEGKFALLIRKVQPKDEGTYECQISTKPTRSIFVVLRIKSEWNEIISKGHFVLFNLRDPYT